MANNIFLKDLTIGQHNDQIKVRVIREWQVKSKDNKYVLSKNYILLDEEGTQIQVSPVDSELQNLELGEVYMISKYYVQRAYAEYRTVPAELVIKLHKTTKTIKLSDISSTIPLYKFQITDFEKARTKAGETVNLMDVVGKLIRVTDMQTVKSGKKHIDILLTSKRDDKMTIRLWENQAHEFLERKTEYIKPNVFVIVTSTSAKKTQTPGEIILWSSLSTHCYFNNDNPDVVELRKRYKTEEDITPAIVPFVKTQQQSIERATIAQLYTAELPAGAQTVSFTTEATVIGINLQKGWYYTGCNKCYKTMPPSLTCSRCTEQTSPTPLFGVKAKVKDSASHTTFMLFERHVRKMINVSAEHILNNDKNASQDVRPPVLNNIVGRKYVFKLTLTEQNTNKKYEGYTVTEVIEEITNEDSMVATPETVDQSHEINQANAEQLKDDTTKKRKLPTQQENSVISDETEKHQPGLEPTDGLNKDLESKHPTPPAMSPNSNEHRDKRQK